MSKPFFFRCQACSRPVSVRSRRCPWCKSWTGLGHGDPVIDAHLGAFRTFGLFAGLWTAILACAVAFGGHSLAGALVGACALALLASHALLPWHVAGWRAAEIAWALAAVLCLAGLYRAGAGLLLVLIPIILLALMLASRRRVLARLAGAPLPSAPAPSRLPQRGPCTWCGGRGADVVAARFCISLVTVTFTDRGSYRNLCPRCARIHALPATIVSVALGWWGIPWGLIRTPEVILDNITRGGVTLDSAGLAELRAQERRQGPQGWSTAAFVVGLFLLPAAMSFAILPNLSIILGR
jgi:hypothetical protein